MSCETYTDIEDPVVSFISSSLECIELIDWFVDWLNSVLLRIGNIFQLYNGGNC